ncbi:exonuclease V [Kockiozyma suomiensis]|uniref:exonuclease V n=1 Tax=Kockiozyma suomiensis TaxID=1337062 RepID=UPI003343CCBE
MIELDLEIPAQSSRNAPSEHEGLQLSSSSPPLIVLKPRRRSPFLGSEGIPPDFSVSTSSSSSDELLPLHFQDATDMKSHSMLAEYRQGWKLNVTDLVSPSYCELQYFYQYYKNSFRRSKAMSKGSEIHRDLELEFNKEIIVDTQAMTEEDKKALDLIAMLVSLQSLSHLAFDGEEAVARELRVFGFIGDIYISGIIDEVSFMSERYNPSGVEFIDTEDIPEPPPRIPVGTPPPASPAEVIEIDDSLIPDEVLNSPEPDSQAGLTPIDLEGSGKPLSDYVTESYPTLQLRQPNITSFFKPLTQETMDTIVTESSQSAEWTPPPEKPRQIRIADSKTRAYRSFPNESQRKSTYFQLLLYRRLFQELTEGNFDFSRVAAHLNLDMNAKLSDAFHNEVLDNEVVAVSFTREIEMGKKPEYVDNLLNMETLHDVWNLLSMKFQEFRGELSDQLSVIYIWQKDAQVFGGVDFTYKEDDLNNYLFDMLSYWRGERDPKGVDVEEAYKCHGCQFKDRCAWRLTKIRESAERNRQAFVKKWGAPPGQLVVMKYDY